MTLTLSNSRYLNDVCEYKIDYLFEEEINDIFSSVPVLRYFARSSRHCTSAISVKTHNLAVNMVIRGRDALDADMQTGRHKHSAFSLTAGIRVLCVRFLTSPISDNE